MSVPAPHRRTLPNVPIDEEGMRQLEMWLLSRMRALLTGGDGIQFDKLNKGNWLSIETTAVAPDAAGDVNRDGTPQGMQFIATGGSVLIEAHAASADGHGVKILDHSNEELLIESEHGATLSGGSGGAFITVDNLLGGITIDAGGSDTVAVESDTDIDGELDMKTHQIHNVVDPTLDQDAATKKYVDDEVGGAGIQFGVTNTGTWLEIVTTSATGGNGISLSATGASHSVFIQSLLADITLDAPAGQFSATVGGGFFATAGTAVQFQAPQIAFWPDAAGKVTIFDSDGTTVLAEWTAS